MIALNQDLATSAHAHHFVAQIVVAHSIIGRPHGEDCQQNHQSELRKTKQQPYQSPPLLIAIAGVSPTGTRLRLAAKAAVMFGVSATKVPAITISTPIHIQATSGFRKTFII